MKYSREEMVKMYEHLIVGRKYGIALEDTIKTKNIVGSIHLPIGQEAASVGVVSAMSNDDYLGHTHRMQPGVVLRYDIDAFTAEMFGRVTGVNGGVSCDYHCSDLDLKMLPLSGFLGVGWPLGVGVAHTLKMDKKDAVVVSVLGDGGSSEGYCFEAMNMAANLKVPMVFVIENNGWAMSTPVSDQTAIADLSDRAKAFGMESTVVDGNDVLAVREAMEDAIAKAKQGKPNVVELKLLRWRGHFVGDPVHVYRTDDAKIADYKENHDPVVNFEKFLCENNLISQEEIDDIDASAQKKVDDAITFGLDSALPTEADILDYNKVYSNNAGGEI